MSMNIGLLFCGVIFLWFILWLSQYLDHVLLSGRMIREKWIGKDFEDAVMT
jgi:hypothetical protein